MSTPIEGQIPQTDVVEQIQPPANLLQCIFGDDRLFVGQSQIVKEPSTLFDGQGGQFGQGLIVDEYTEGLATQSTTVARAAALGAHILTQLTANLVIALMESLFDRVESTFVAVSVRPRVAALIGVVEIQFLVAEPMEEPLLLFLRQV